MAKTTIKLLKIAFKAFGTFVLMLSFMLSQVQFFSAYEARVVNVTANLSDRCDDYSIIGYKFNDRNQDTHKDNGEEGLPNWTTRLQKVFEEKYDYSQDNVLNSNDALFLQDVVDGVLTCPVSKQCDFNVDGQLNQSDVGAFQIYLADRNQERITDNTGFYAFNSLSPGDYIVSEVMKDGWRPISDPVRNISLIQCGANMVDFGNFPSEERTFCGDGRVQTPNSDGIFEQCDDGNTIDGDGCSSQCQLEVCEGQITLDFDNDAEGTPILKGQFIDSEYSAWGVNVSAHNYNESHPQVAITFDSDVPSGGDIDLGTPNKMFGGPGDSESGDGSEPSNNTALHNLLIIPEYATDINPADGYVDDPNDEPSGGSLRFIFDRNHTFSSAQYIDLDHNGGEVVGYTDAAGTNQIFSLPVAPGNGNSVITVNGNESTIIRYLKMRGGDSYAVDNIKLCPATYCGDGKVQNPNNDGIAEACDDGNNVDGDGCNSQCEVEECEIPPPPHCEGKVESMIFEYLGGDCLQSYHSQEEGKVTCTGDSGNTSPVYIIVNNKDSAENDQAKIWFEGSVDMNGRFTALASNGGETRFTSDTRVHVFDQQGGTRIQYIKFHTSCSQPLNIGDQFGSLRLVGLDTTESDPFEAGPQCFQEPFCGDGIIQTREGEQCDDGNNSSGDGCSSQCVVEPTIVLNEFVPNPVGNDGQHGLEGEWVELYNLSSVAKDLNGWKIKDAAGNSKTISASRTHTGSTIIGVNGSGSEWLVVFMNASVLGNSGDTINLLDSNDVLLDTHTYGNSIDPDLDDDPESTPGDENDLDGNVTGAGKSFARIPDGTGPWIDPVPTPGGPNKMSNDNTTTYNEQSLLQSQPQEQQDNISWGEVFLVNTIDESLESQIPIETSQEENPIDTGINPDIIILIEGDNQDLKNEANTEM